MPPDRQARVEEYLSVSEPDEEPRKLRRTSPDGHIVEQPGTAKSTGGGLAVQQFVADEPFRVRRRSRPQTLRHIQIVDLKANRRVVTAIEFISLANKAYDNGRYRSDLNFTTMPDPPLKAEEQAWITDYLKGKVTTQDGTPVPS